MADKRNEKPNQTPGGKSFSVEDILTEFSTARNSGRIVQFPTPPPREEPEEPVRKKDPEDTGQIIDLPSTGNIPFEVTQRVKGLFRRAGDYADRMYEHAAPTPEELKAERYIPGTDKEDTGAPPPVHRPRRLIPRTPPPEDVPPAKLAARSSKSLKGTRLRLSLAFLLSALCLYLGLELPLPALPAGLPVHTLRLSASAVLLGLTCLLCGDVVWTGIRTLFTARPGAETLCALSALFTLADTLTMPVLSTREETLPCAAPACFVLAFALWGRRKRLQADRISCRTAAQARQPYLVTRDEGKWSGRPAYCKWSGTQWGFGSQLQMADGVSLLYRVASPVLVLACLLCALLASYGRQRPEQFLWSASSALTAAASCSALLCFSLPYHALAKRLAGLGAALAGWKGVERCGGGSLILTDADLFPPGTVKLNGIKIFGDFPTEKVVGYASSLIKGSQSSLEKPFSDLMKAQNALYRPVRSLRFFEGGMTGAIRDQEVLVGTASFMKLMNIPLPQGLNVKSAVFCAIGGELAGIFALRYTLHSSVIPCVSTLTRNRFSPLLATRDPNLIPSLLGEKFRLPVEKMEFPSVDRRLELSDPNQDHDDAIVALLCREGLGPYCETVVGAKRLRAASLFSAAFSVTGGVVGLVLTFYLTSVDAYHSLTPLALLVFLLAWLVPVLVASDWVGRY